MKDVREHYKIADPDFKTRAVMALASAMHFAETDHPVVSWKAQEDAYRFYCKNGIDKVMDKLTELGGSL